MKYSLRSLMIVVAVAPPMLAVACSLIYVLLLWPYQAENYNYIPQPPLFGSEQIKRWHEQNDEFVEHLEHEQHLAAMGQLARFGGILTVVVLGVAALAFIALRQRNAPPNSSAPAPNPPKP